MKIKDILNLPINTNIEINGWITTFRKQKNLSFINLNDGSNANGIQLIMEKELDNLLIGTSINVNGKIVNSPGEGQDKEIIVNQLKIIGNVMDNYPLIKGRMNLDTLRNYQHLRGRTKTFGCIFRIKSNIWNATNLFYQKEGFLHLDPNILTINECEGGAGVFSVCEDKKLSWDKDHFGKPVYLTVSSQLHLEALACSLGDVYTMNKSFRAEHSNTNKHLSEFTHLEIEKVFCTLDDLMEHAEKYIKYIIKYLLENNKKDLETLDNFVSKGLLEQLNLLLNQSYQKIKYKYAIKIIPNEFNPIDGEDLSSNMENWLCSHFNSPVFITHWPAKIKSFYMKQDNDYCQSFDLLMPYGVGELIGGSMREDNLDKLKEIMNQKGVKEEGLEFYLDLRKYGSIPHGGFGLGLDRLTMLLTGIKNIKDTIPFPISYLNCLV